MSHYLITGGAGFIGTNLTKQLLGEGHQVRIIDNYAGGKKEERIQGEAEYIEGDIRNMDDLNKAMQGIDGVFHMAALPRVSFSVEHPQETHDVNINGTLNVLLAARDNGVKRVVFSSSSSTYGDQPKEVYPLAENDVMNISEGLKEIGIGGLTVIKVRGRGAKTAAEIHTSKGMEIFVPHFADKFRIMVVIPESKEEKSVEIIKKNSREGKIFISQILRAIDIKSGNEGEEVI